MHIPETLAIVQYSSNVAVIRYTSFLKRKQETVHCSLFVEEQYPHLFKPGFVSRPTLDISQYYNSREKQVGLQVITESQPNTPTTGWAVLGSNGHECHLCHPAWGVWTLSNNEVLYLMSKAPLEQQAFQFYAHDGVLQLGLAEDLTGLVTRSDSPENCLSNLSMQDVGKTIKVGSSKYLILDMGPKTVQLFDLASLYATHKPRLTSYYSNGLQQKNVQFSDLNSPLPTLTKLLNASIRSEEKGNTAETLDHYAQIMKDVLAFEFIALMQECFSFKKKFHLKWDPRSSPDRPVQYTEEGRTPVCPKVLVDKMDGRVISHRPFISFSQINKRQYRAEVYTNYHLQAPAVEVVGNLEYLRNVLIDTYRVPEIHYPSEAVAYMLTA